MVLTGEYAERAKRNYKTAEGKQLLAAVRIALGLLDAEMDSPSTPERGKKIAAIINNLEIAADQYDLYGEKDRRRISAIQSAAQKKAWKRRKAQQEK